METFFAFLCIAIPPLHHANKARKDFGGLTAYWGLSNILGFLFWVGYLIFICTVGLDPLIPENSPYIYTIITSLTILSGMLFSNILYPNVAAFYYSKYSEIGSYGDSESKIITTSWTILILQFICLYYAHFVSNYFRSIA